MTLAIGHQEDNVVVPDAIRERRPPFNPEDVVLEFPLRAGPLLSAFAETQFQNFQ